MRALAFIIALSFLFPSLATPSLSDELVLKSRLPTCKTVYSDGSTGPYGYATVWRRSDGTEYSRQCDFLGAPRVAMSDIGMPEDGSWPVNMNGVHEATKVTVLPNGHIKLY